MIMASRAAPSSYNDVKLTVGAFRQFASVWCDQIQWSFVDEDWQTGKVMFTRSDGGNDAATFIVDFFTEGLETVVLKASGGYRTFRFRSIKQCADYVGLRLRNAIPSPEIHNTT